jgi:hypothetical protein
VVYVSACAHRITRAPDAVQGHHEMPPYSDGSMRSAYHVRELEAYRLAQVHALCSAAMLPKHAIQQDYSQCRMPD